MENSFVRFLGGSSWLCWLGTLGLSLTSFFSLNSVGFALMAATWGSWSEVWALVFLDLLAEDQAVEHDWLGLFSSPSIDFGFFLDVFPCSVEVFVFISLI